MKLTDMNNSAISSMYRANRIYSGPASTAKHGTIISVPHNGKNVRIQAKPIAPVAEYDAWLRGSNRHRNSHNKRTGAKLRRIVIMRRQGSSWAECGAAVGVVGSCAKDWVDFLPFDLAV
jgi:hypothetical protein